jgi:hypothetical protein
MASERQIEERRRRDREYANRRNRLIAYGQWQPPVDAERARQHVRALLRSGTGARKIAAAAGVAHSVVVRLIYGAPAENRPPTRRLRPDVAEKLLAVEPEPPAAIGARRRLQALVAVGWSLRQLAPRLGITYNAASLIANGTRTSILPSTAEAVRRVYDELWNAQPPTGTRAERISVTKARSYADRLGWLPPLAWDDDLIDLADTALAAELGRRVEEMTDEEVRRCYTARYEHGDMSPLTAEGAREYRRRARRRELAASDATPVGVA